MRPVHRRVLILAIALAALAALTGPAAAHAGGVRIHVQRSAYGPILFDRAHRALYLFQRDGRKKTRCFGECARRWPPLRTTSRPRAGHGVKQRLLGRIRRPNGTWQATYNGHPLYRYFRDTPNNVFCQNIAEFGGLWLVVNGRGRAVR
jgi:predicted lipoprotein with Yx(FWY)xxD motif